METDNEQGALEIISSNARCAFDQRASSDYDGADDCIGAYLQNAFDTLREHKLDRVFDPSFVVREFRRVYDQERATEERKERDRRDRERRAYWASKEAMYDCDCSDPGCPVHRGKSTCVISATQRLYRVDMDDPCGSRFCGACASDAFASGLFGLVLDDIEETSFEAAERVVTRDCVQHASGA